MARTSDKNAGYGVEIPPPVEMVRIFFDQLGVTEKRAFEFIEIHRRNDWRSVTGRPIRNWKARANEWIWNLNHK